VDRCLNTMDLKVKSIVVLSLFPLFLSANSILPDPTRPATYLIEDTEPVYVEDFDVEKINWNLSAIRISKNDKSAIVNGKLVREGDEIEKAKVLEIKPRSVIIDHEDNKLIVRLFKNEVVKNYK
jgi:hypothetical protein